MCLSHAHCHLRPLLRLPRAPRSPPLPLFHAVATLQLRGHPCPHPPTIRSLLSSSSLHGCDAPAPCCSQCTAILTNDFGSLLWHHLLLLFWPGCPHATCSTSLAPHHRAAAHTALTANFLLMTLSCMPHCPSHVPALNSRPFLQRSPQVKYFPFLPAADPFAAPDPNLMPIPAPPPHFWLPFPRLLHTKPAIPFTTVEEV